MKILVTCAAGFIGYRPQVSVEEGVRRFVAWYRWFYGVYRQGQTKAVGAETLT